MPLVFTTWILAVTAGTSYFSGYSATPGEAGTPSAVWPVVSRLLPANDRSTLVLFAHPRCSCTRATLDELSVILDKSANQLQIYVVFLGFSQEAGARHDTGLWKAAHALPGVIVKEDFDYRESHAFGIATSGHALLYSRHGQLLFSGGITSQRGQTGTNIGRRSILALVKSQLAESHTTPVYGCPLEEKAGP